jgi:lysophospholipase L1-like esterase
MYQRAFYVALTVIVIGVLLGFWAVNRLGGWRYSFNRLYTQSAWPNYTQRMSQLELLKLDSAQLVLLGDSHIAHGEWHEWLHPLQVANRGIPGEGIEGLLAFAKTLPLDTSMLLVVQIGTNDLLFHQPEEVTRRYRTLINYLNERGLSVYYTTLPGVNNAVRKTGLAADKVAEINTWLRTQAASGKIQLVDLAAALGTVEGLLPADLTDDGVHLRGAGYQRWTSALRDNIKRVERSL